LRAVCAGSLSAAAHRLRVLSKQLLNYLSTGSGRRLALLFPDILAALAVFACVLLPTPAYLRQAVPLNLNLPFLSSP